MLKGLFWWIDSWRSSSAYADMDLKTQGAYRNLLDEAWLRDGALPNDERVLAKACGDALAWPDVREAVLAKFEVTPTGLRTRRLDQVLAETQRRARNQKAYRERKRGIDNDAGNAAANDTANDTDNDADNDNGRDNAAANRSDSPSPSPDLDLQENTHTPPLPRRRLPDQLMDLPYKNAEAIAHSVLEKWPDDSSQWRSEFKARCNEQGWNYATKESADVRPMIDRALDAVEHQRAARKVRGITPARSEQQLSRHAFQGKRLRVPTGLHDDFLAALGGDAPGPTLLAWYELVDYELLTTGEAIVPTIWKWLDARFQQWVVDRAGEAEMARFLEAPLRQAAGGQR